MYGVLYLEAKDADGDNVLVGYPAVRLSTHFGAHSPVNQGPARVEVLVGRLKGRQYAPTFLDAGVAPTSDNHFVPLTNTPAPLYFGASNG
jgi:hypothetical protein